MKDVPFRELSARKIYTDYMNRVKQATAVLATDDQLDLLMEFNSHIYEAMQQKPVEAGEADALVTVLEKLGNPEQVLKPLVAERKLKEATRTFNPKHVYQALLLNLKNGIIYGVFGILYLLLACFSLLIITKIIAPSKTGLFYRNDQFDSFGFIADTSGTQEILGYWFIPVVAITVVTLYLLITFLFRTTNRR
ncbi:MAG: hypothetical protein HYZ14_07265 [Bacteroidetes bacterium]|nr:hypothetical protein [Bacteroidota bacterium]